MVRLFSFSYTKSMLFSFGLLLNLPVASCRILSHPVAIDLPGAKSEPQLAQIFATLCDSLDRPVYALLYFSSTFARPAIMVSPTSTGSCSSIYTVKHVQMNICWMQTCF